jgi:predicted nuclease with RNAse H fold
VLTLGIDLAAQPEQTALAWIEWLPGQAIVRDACWGADDKAILAAMAEADKVGIDCPLGWPDAFITFVRAHQAGSVAIPRGIADRGWRRSLTLRLTDKVVRQETLLTPLSVSGDRIGHVAMRCAVLLAQLAQRSTPVDRSGSGKIAEVYPAASLKIWGLRYRGYKRPGDTQTVGKLVSELLQAAPWLELGEAEFLCRSRHDAVDAVVASLTARAADRNLTMRPRTPEESAAARTEGWIALPLADSLLSQLP